MRNAFFMDNLNHTLRETLKKVGDSISAANANWSFDEDVCRNFEKHISKSVPLYEKGHDLILKISDFFLNDNSICYDLGCSTGSLIKKLSERNSTKRVKYIGIDSVENMVKEAENNCSSVPDAEFQCNNILDVDLEKNDLVICYYTMQFINPRHRQVLIDNIYKSLNWGGGFLLFEKVRAPDARFQDMMTSIYTDFKLDQGYSPDEIVAKSRSLKGVLEPFSTRGNQDLLKRAGFIDIMTVMKFVCFEGFLAIK